MAGVSGDEVMLPIAEYQPKPQPVVGLRVATYNVRVDHHEDYNTVHEWVMRRELLSNTLLSLSADIIAIQECSLTQAADIEVMLGPEWDVQVKPCDPNAWASAPGVGPSDGDQRMGNGFIWRRSRVTQLEPSKTAWLSPRPDGPWIGGEAPWGGSYYQHTCEIGRFLDTRSGNRVGVLCAHFDNTGDDARETGGSEARRQSALLVMGRAQQLRSTNQADVVVVCGDFNTLLDKEGAAYSALMAAADGQLVDVRDVPGVYEADGGRASSSWEGWETDPACRAVAGDQRYDQMFVSAEVEVRRTAVVEDRYPVYFSDQFYWTYASDHLPIVTEMLVPVGKSARLGPPPNFMGGAPKPPKTVGCLMTLGGVAMCLLLLFLWLIWDMFYTTYECQMQCRNRATDPPLGCHVAAPPDPPMLPPFASPFAPPPPL